MMQISIMTRKRSALLWLPAALLLTVGAEASPIGVEAPDFTVVVNETTFSSDMLGLEATGDPGDFRTVGMMARPDDWTFMWDLVVDADPIIGGTFSILNTTSSTRRFDLTFNLPIAPPLTNTQYQGLLDVTLTDADGTAIPGSSSTFAEYTNLNWFGLIDGAQVLNLAGVETGLCFGANCSVNLKHIAGPDVICAWCSKHDWDYAEFRSQPGR